MNVLRSGGILALSLTLACLDDYTPPDDFSLSLSNPSVTIDQGDTAQVGLTVVHPEGTDIAFTVTGLPAGATAVTTKQVAPGSLPPKPVMPAALVGALKAQAAKKAAAKKKAAKSKRR